MLMQSSGRLGIAGLLTMVGSCVALLGTMFLALLTWMEYFVSFHYGVRIITEPFYVATAIIIFGLAASALGLLSASNTLNRRKYSLAILGATFLLTAGLLPFTSILFSALPYVETLGGTTGWTIYELYAGIPIIILATTSLILIAPRKTEFTNQETNTQTTLKAILLLTAATSAASALFSLIPLQQLAGQFASNYALSTMTVSTCTFTLTALGVLLMKKNHPYPIIALTVLSIISALALPFIFNSIYPWIGSIVKGLVTASPIITLSTTALILEIITANKK